MGRTGGTTLATTTDRKPLDPRDQPIYTIPAAAWYLALPHSTVRFWTVGGEYLTTRGRKRASPLIELAETDPAMLSFWNLVEVYVLDGIRRHHKVSLQKVRKALQYVGEHLKVDRPLINQEFLTDGVDLFVDRYTQLINVTSQEGQLALRDLLKGSIQRIERDPKGLASRLYPWLRKPDEPREVEIDPSRQFGKRVLAGTGIPTEVLGERFRAGDTIDHLARDYRLSREQIEAALRWEQCAAVQ